MLATYGTGAVMAVPAHDERDFAFATKYGLPIVKVIEKKGGETELPFTEDGIMVGSLQFDGLFGEEARAEVAAYISKLGKGGKKINYRLRDWLVSRQRYWGAPIPVVHCPVCGDVPVPEKDLPVRLPYDVEFRPDGKSPLAKYEKFMHTACPKCGGEAMRDPDTLDTFVCSSWYYLRYADAHNEKEPFSREAVDKMLPVDVYVGGAEHACMHLLYARFFTKALRDMGYLDFDEPFRRLVHQGVILGPDGNRMSKSHGNIVSPDEYVETVRLGRLPPLPHVRLLLYRGRPVERRRHQGDRKIFGPRRKARAKSQRRQSRKETRPTARTKKRSTTPRTTPSTASPRTLRRSPSIPRSPASWSLSTRSPSTTRLPTKTSLLKKRQCMTL